MKNWRCGYIDLGIWARIEINKWKILVSSEIKLSIYLHSNIIVKNGKLHKYQQVIVLAFPHLYTYIYIITLSFTFMQQWKLYCPLPLWNSSQIALPIENMDCTFPTLLLSCNTLKTSTDLSFYSQSSLILFHSFFFFFFKR